MNIHKEADNCLLCLDAPCSRACPKSLHPDRAIRAIRFNNEHVAHHWFGNECLECNAPCETACLHPDRHIRIKETARISMATARPVPAELPDLSTDFCGIRCENPFFLASSAICTNYEMISRAFDAGWAGVVYKTITCSQTKEVSPRFDAVSKGNTQFVGFRNMEQASEKSAEVNFSIIRRLKDNYPNKVIVASIMGQNVREWVNLARDAEAAGADIVELNFSCPHMYHEGMGSDVGQNPELVAFFSGHVKDAVKIPVIAKMAPDITHIASPAMAAYFAGCNGIAAINTIKSITMDESAKVNGRRTISGYSGKAIKPIAQRHILEIVTNPLMQREDRQLQLSGIGGIETWRDALEYIQLGCQNVQVCTAVMQYGYRIIDDLILGLQTYMLENGVEKLEQLIGSEIHTFCHADELDRGTVVFPKWDFEKCTGCGRCYISCNDAGHQAISFGQDRRPHLIGQKCVGCHLCRLVCPTQAIGSAIRIVKRA